MVSSSSFLSCWQRGGTVRGDDGVGGVGGAAVDGRRGETPPGDEEEPQRNGPRGGGSRSERSRRMRTVGPPLGRCSISTYGGLLHGEGDEMREGCLHRRRERRGEGGGPRMNDVCLTGGKRGGVVVGFRFPPSPAALRACCVGGRRVREGFLEEWCVAMRGRREGWQRRRRRRRREARNGPTDGIGGRDRPRG